MQSLIQNLPDLGLFGAGVSFTTICLAWAYKTLRTSHGKPPETHVVPPIVKLDGEAMGALGRIEEQNRRSSDQLTSLGSVLIKLSIVAENQERLIEQHISETRPAINRVLHS